MATKDVRWVAQFSARLLAALVLAGSVAGCGGGAQPVGKAAVNFSWPAAARQVNDLSGAQSIRVTIGPTSQVLNRPATSLHFDGLPAGVQQVRVESFSEADAGGQLLAVAFWQVTVTAGQEVVLTVTAEPAPVVRVDLIEEHQGLSIGDRYQLHMVLRDAQERVVLVPLAQAGWLSDRPAVATTSSTGLVTAVGAGSTLVHAVYTPPAGAPLEDTCTVSVAEGGSDEHPPFADLTVAPTTGDVDTDFFFDASGSWDLENSREDLEFRFDVDGNGTPDTGWQHVPRAFHRFTEAGVYDASVDVRDTDGLLDFAHKSFEVLVALDVTNPGLLTIRQSVTLEAVVRGSLNTQVHWTFVPGNGIVVGGRYTAPDRPGHYVVTVTTDADARVHADIPIEVVAGGVEVTVQ